MSLRYSTFQRAVTMDIVEIWIIPRCQLHLARISRAAKHLGEVSSGRGAEGRVGFLVGVVQRRVALASSLV